MGASVVCFKTAAGKPDRPWASCGPAGMLPGCYNSRGSPVWRLRGVAARAVSRVRGCVVGHCVRWPAAALVADEDIERRFLGISRLRGRRPQGRAS